MKKLPQDDSLELRVTDLETDWTRIMGRLDALEKKAEGLRVRLGHLLPERHYCPHCKALISQLSEVCGSCGKTLRSPKDLKAGQPR